MNALERLEIAPFINDRNDDKHDAGEQARDADEQQEAGETARTADPFGLETCDHDRDQQHHQREKDLETPEDQRESVEAVLECAAAAEGDSGGFKEKSQVSVACQCLACQSRASFFLVVPRRSRSTSVAQSASRPLSQLSKPKLIPSEKHDRAS